MIKNSFRIAWRNLVKNKTFSIINIAGLAIGIASCLLLFTVVKYELSYDTFQPDYKRIYRVVTRDNNSGDISYTPGIPFPALEALKLDFPETTIGALLANFGSQVTVMGNSGTITESNKKFIEQTGFFFCNQDFFKVFHYDWLVGSPDNLKEPNVTVLTQKTADKYFGNWKTSVGQYLKLDNAITVKVVGIIKDPPANTDFPLGIISSYETAKASHGIYTYSNEWGLTTSNFQLYLKLPENADAGKINARLVTFSKKSYSSKRNDRLNFLQPLSDLHFDKRFDSFSGHVTSKATLWTLSLIGLFIIIMACINFINLSTAQAVGRSKEIGIKKVLGGYRWQLFRQVMGETFLVVMISVLLAVVIAAFCMPLIKHVAIIEQSLSLFNIPVILFLISLTLLITLLAGIYPAMIVSGFKPLLALKNKITSATIGGISVRRGLVIMQFSISQILIIATIIAITQMNFIKNADIGFNKDAVLIINANSDSIMQSRQQSYKEKLLTIPGVQSVSFSSDAPSSDNNAATNFGFDHKKPNPTFNLYTKFADEDYFKTFGLEMLAGRGFSKSDTADEIVVNETLVKKLDLKSSNDMIGKQLYYTGSSWKTVVGVVKDFKTNSLKEHIKPLAIAEDREFYGVTSVKLRSGNLQKTRASVEEAWNQSFPEYAFTSTYMQDNLNEFYKQDEQLSLLYKIFAAIAIVISCLGLYGLVTFMAIQKTKEIGIRKVLGASVNNIIYFFSKEFTILIVVGFLIAIPVAWYMMHNWLQNFVFRIKITPVAFLLTIIISIGVAWLAVGYKSIKAAIANPIKSLRTE